MSKRVLIILGVGLLLIVGAFFLHKHEVNQDFETLDVEPELETKPRKSKKQPDEAIKEDPAGTITTESGTEEDAATE